MSRILLGMAAAAFAFVVGCGGEPAPSVQPDAGETDPPIILDGGVILDLGVEAHDDATVEPDASDDAGVIEPDASEDSGVAPDTGEPDDAGNAPDAGEDAGTPPDSGVPDLTDTDGDNITDQQEGNGNVNTDGDGDPDTADQDSDNDGIPDSIEAGDVDLLTPPIDTDGDTIPNFRDSDSDNDGIPDSTEGAGDLDNDGIPDFIDTDTDGDFILDVDEGAADFDGDTLPNYRDPDSDNDGVSDADEAGDQVLVTPPDNSDFAADQPDFLDADSDNDTIADLEEGAIDSDGDGIPDRIDIDSDNDSVLDFVEAGDADLLTAARNSDADGIPDFRDPDSDNDFMADLVERTADTDTDGTPDRLDSDSDNDGVPDAIEAGDQDLGTLPFNTDGDSYYDYIDLDSDNDGLADAVETGCPGASNRVAADSDGDGFIDPAELAYGSNPCASASGIDDFYFVLPPLGPPQNAPLIFSNTDIDRADMAINMDNTGSMGGEIATLRQALSTTIIPGVVAVIPDTAVAVSSYEDYPINPFGDPVAGDVPFRLNTRVTTSVPAAQAAVNALVTRSGVDFPESGMESLYQVASGQGTTWPSGQVAPFNPALNRVVGVADGTIGGAGFRDDALPIIVHITDALSHTRADYQAVNAAIDAATPAEARQALSGIGARVVSLTGLTSPPFNDLMCSGQLANIFAARTAGDVDWFLLQGAVAGDSIRIETYASGYGSNLDTMVAIANATGIIAVNDDLAPGVETDSDLTATLSGAGPYYVAVTAYNDTSFTGTGGTSTGHYLALVRRNGNFVYPSPTACRAEDSNNRTNATVLVDGATAVPPADFAQCVTQCEAILGPFSPFFEDFTFPVEYSEETNAVIPACAWSSFGPGRPANCPVDQCCTGLNGAGVAPNVNGMCPLTFAIDVNGGGLSNAVVSGIEALVKFSTFTITTAVRGDPSAAIDTTCFIHGVVPTTATPPNSCAPVPLAVDLLPPTPELDSFENVVPGTVLQFQVNAVNQVGATAQPCVASGASPQLFRAYIDLLADGVTVVDTRDVIIIVPPTVTGGPS